MSSFSVYRVGLSFLGFFGVVLCSVHNDFYERRYDHYHGKYSDSELMVDILNNFGLRILMAHNEHNENNMAFSPYGVGVVLMALGEGLRGEALYEIRKALYLPYDAHTIRVGLRDIHRHLKSYFIPKEGFLAGITLNVENVSINPDYINLLKFYGYDIKSFNTALYPDKHVTTTESGVIGGREETTLTTESINFSTTTIPETTVAIEETDRTTSDSSVISTTSGDILGTTPTEIDQTSTIENKVITSTLQTIATTESTAVTSTSASTITYTTENVLTTDESATAFITEQEIDNPEETTSATTDTENMSTQTTSIMDGQTTSIPTVSSNSEPSTEMLSTSTETMGTMASSTMQSLETKSTTDNSETSTPNMRMIRSSEENQNPEEDESSIRAEMEMAMAESEMRTMDSKEKPNEDNNIDEVVTGNWSIRINNQITLLNSNEDLPITQNRFETTINNERRNTRSVEEYVITRFYHFNNFRPAKKYEPHEPLYFFINENTKEAGLDFMTYDTVLPFLYLPNPSTMALAFPLDSDKYFLLLMMPSETYRLNDLICQLYMHNTFKYILNNLELTHVRVNIPSFSLNGRITLTNTLQKLGIRRIFEPRQADFSPMTSTEGVYVTNIEQAISVTIKNNLSIKKDARHGHFHSEPVRFDFNHPFLYFVVDSELQVILMTGKVVNPLNARIK